MLETKEITKQQLDKFKKAIDDYDIEKVIDEGIDPIIAQAYLDALKSMYEDLRDQYSEL